MSRFGKLLRSAAAAALTAVGAPSATAQQTPATLPDAINYMPEGAVSPAGFGRAGSAAPCQPGCPPGQCYPSYQPYQCSPQQPGVPPAIPVTPSPIAEAAQIADAGPGFGSGGTAGAGSLVGLGGYLENAAPVTMFRLRSDFAYGNNRPDRAEFFYAKCGCFGTPDAKGPPLAEKKVDYQQLIPYLEVAVTNRWSVFGDIPVRFINPTVNENAAGLSDVTFGTKYAFVYNQQRVMSFWLRTVAPSGNTTRGLGQGNWRIEPGLLWLEQVNRRFQLFGQVIDSIPLDRQSDFTGNVIQYGLGGSYILAMGRWGYLAPVVEGVGWTVLSGKEANDFGAVSAVGDTIVNAKFGLRIGFGEVKPGTPYPTRSDLYVGYGRAVTGAVWYKDLLRLEYRLFF